MKRKSKRIKLKFEKIVLLFIVYSSVIICFTTFIFHKLEPLLDKNFKDFIATTGTLGDTFGGLLGPFIGIIASILTYNAFMVQVQANQQQNKQFNKQFLDTKKSDFENRFYELLAIHKENAREINEAVEKKNGFKLLFLELRYTYYYIEKSVFDGDRDKYDKKKDKLLNSYLNKKLIKNEKSSLEKLFLIFLFNGEFNYSYALMYLLPHLDGGNKIDAESLVISINNASDTNPIQFEFNRPSSRSPFILEEYDKNFTFKGHFNRLNKYFLNLSTLIEHIIEQDKKVISKKNKNKYFETLRSLLSHEELILIYLINFTSFSKISEESLLQSKILYDFSYREVDFTFQAPSYFKFKNKDFDVDAHFGMAKRYPEYFR